MKRFMPLTRPGTFRGRKRELNFMAEAFKERGARAVVIHGPEGSGKTALASEAASVLSPEFDYFYAFDCRGGRSGNTALAMEEVFVGLCRFLDLNGIGEFQNIVYSNLPVELKAGFIGQVLAGNRVLIVFDDFDSSLKEDSGRWAVADEALREGLSSLIRKCPAGSRFIFTSRHPFDLGDGEMEGLIEGVALDGFTSDEATEAMDSRPELAALERAIKQQFFEKTSGSPFAISMLGGLIRQGAAQGSLEQALGAISASAPGAAASLELLKMLYAGLGEAERKMLLCASAFRRAAPLSALRWMAKGEADTKPRLDALCALGLLAEVDVSAEEPSYRMQTLIRDYVSASAGEENLKALLCEAALYYEDAAKKARDLWLLLEARELYLEALEYEQAGLIVSRLTEPLNRGGLRDFALTLNRATIRTAVGPARAAALQNLGVMYAGAGSYEQALEAFAESAGLFGALGDHLGSAKALAETGNIHFMQGRTDEAMSRYSECLGIFEGLGDSQSVARTLFQIGMVQGRRGEPELALETFGRSIEVFEGSGDVRGLSEALLQRGDVFAATGRIEEALKEYARSLELSEGAGDRTGVATALNREGSMRFEMGRYAEALEIFKNCLAIYKEQGHKRGAADTLHGAGMACHALGELDSAIGHYTECLQIKEELGDKPGVAMTLHRLGTVHAGKGEHRAALKNLLISLSILHSLKHPAAESVAAALAALGEETGREEFECLQAEVIKEITGGHRPSKGHSPIKGTQPS